MMNVGLNQQTATLSGTWKKSAVRRSSPLHYQGPGRSQPFVTAVAGRDEVSGPRRVAQGPKAGRLHWHPVALT